MIISNNKFAAYLLLELDKGYDQKSLADWADSMYFKNAKNLTPEASAILEKIFLSQYGNDSISEFELLNLIINLIKA